MKYRVSDTDIVNIDKVEFIEVDGHSINFHTSSSVHQSIYNNEMESNCVFNNIINHFGVTDLRFEGVKKPENEAGRKEKAFEMFYNLYDKKVDKPRARVAFLQLSINEMGEAIKGVKAYVDSTPDKKYRKNPTTWVNRKSWRNEIVSDEKTNDKNRYIKPKYISDER